MQRTGSNLASILLISARSVVVCGGHKTTRSPDSTCGIRWRCSALNTSEDWDSATRVNLGWFGAYEVREEKGLLTSVLGHHHASGEGGTQSET